MLSLRIASVSSCLLSMDRRGLSSLSGEDGWSESSRLLCIMYEQKYGSKTYKKKISESLDEKFIFNLSFYQVRTYFERRSMVAAFRDEEF